MAKRTYGFPSVDAQENARVKSGIGGSRMLPTILPVCAGVLPLACMGVREPDPHHPERAPGHGGNTGYRSRLANSFAIAFFDLLPLRNDLWSASAYAATATGDL